VTATEDVRHLLAVAVQVTDHFLGTPVADELDVRLDGRERPGRVLHGNGRRHADGTYRFVDVPDGGPHAITVASVDERWIALAPPPQVVFPVAQPTQPLVIEVWPTSKQATPLGMTALRGKLVGAPAATIGQRVEVDVDTVDTGHHTRTGPYADVLFPLPGRLELDADGMVPLTVRVVGRTVTGGELVEGERRTPFGASFVIAPGREAHVRLFVT
jgi:hypothetical protein